MPEYAILGARLKTREANEEETREANEENTGGVPPGTEQRIRRNTVGDRTKRASEEDGIKIIAAIKIRKNAWGLAYVEKKL